MPPKGEMLCGPYHPSIDATTSSNLTTAFKFVFTERKFMDSGTIVIYFLTVRKRYNILESEELRITLKTPPCFVLGPYVQNHAQAS